ncbi:MAG: hypothetical protein FJX77_13550 [Armatimonadetes bacterium]|nr:hypothetical protein [Armatimonadota bacterium]
MKLHRTVWLAAPLLLGLAGIQHVLDAPAQAQGSGAGITEIRIERTPCFGFCPEDVLTLRRDGTAEYEGRRGVDRIGAFQGFVSDRDFARLARLAEKNRYFSLREFYGENIADTPGIDTRITRRARTKHVFNNADQGPVGLWELERAALGVGAGIRWEAAKKE